ncbi:hypothetical protein ATJ78_0705 [Paramicrobacterium agarici]|uniref:DUF4352 domain-containing protein n=1 Tax=Paramicrobacterium agarici TaxID=630514 RepID=A0A2A9DV17_9MICO|nr:hypothetical protein ATJ78_0705 [Microbacterium agarici]
MTYVDSAAATRAERRLRSSALHTADGTAVRLPDAATSPADNRVNGFGVAALVIGVVSLIGAVIPIVNYATAVLGVLGVVLGIVGMSVKLRRKAMAITGSILSFIAIVLSVVLAVSYTAGFINMLNDIPAADQRSTDAAGEPGDADNPLAIGTPAVLGADTPEWEVTVDSVLVDSNVDDYATTAYGSEPSEGHRFIAITATVTYLDEGSALPSSDLQVTFVDRDGVEHATRFGNPQGPGTAFDDLDRLSTDDTATGSVVIEVPEDTMNGGLVRVALGTTAECYFGAH